MYIARWQAPRILRSIPIAVRGTARMLRLGQTRRLPPNSSCRLTARRLAPGLAPSAAFLERSLALTPEPGRRAQRALAAAQAKQRAGEPDAALALLKAAEEGPLDELQRAQVDVVRAKTAFSLGHSRDAPSLLLAAAAQLAPLTPRLARDTYLDALTGALFVGRMAGDVGVAEVARAVRAAPAASDPRAADLLLDGVALVITDGHAAGAPLLKRAISAYRVEDMDSDAAPLALARHPRGS